MVYGNKGGQQPTTPPRTQRDAEREERRELEAKLAAGEATGTEVAKLNELRYGPPAGCTGHMAF